MIGLKSARLTGPRGKDNEYTPFSQILRRFYAPVLENFYKLYGNACCSASAQHAFQASQILKFNADNSAKNPTMNPIKFAA